MHGGANELYPVMHGGGVQLSRGMQHQAPADVYPAIIHGGLGVPRPHHGGVFRPKIIVIYIFKR